MNPITSDKVFSTHHGGADLLKKRVRNFSAAKLSASVVGPTAASQIRVAGILAVAGKTA